MGEVNPLENLFFFVLEATALLKVHHGFLVLGLLMFLQCLLVLENLVDTERAVVVLILKDVIPDAPSLEA